MLTAILRSAGCAALICLTACQQEQTRSIPYATTAASASGSLTELLREFTIGHYERLPNAAVNSGLHAYDGRLPDFSPEGIRERVSWLEGMRRRAASIDHARLGVKERLYHGFLEVEIDTQLFNIQTLKVMQNNAWYDYLALDPNVYLARDYAPLPVRMDACIRHVNALPATLQAMRRTLQPMPSGHAEGMRDYLAGLARFVTTAPNEVFAAVNDPARQAAMQLANTQAAAALNDLAHWVEVLPRNEAFALGAQKYAQMLWALERIDTPIADIKAHLERDLERNLQSLQKACAAFAPGMTVIECRARVAARKPPEGPVAAATRQVAQLENLILERGIVTLPAERAVVVAESPPQWRSSSPYIAVPGLHETTVTPSVYYLSSPDPAWPAQEQRDFMLSESDLMSVTTHCVWSGHILETLRSNHSGNPLAVFTYSYAYTEGWSHYSEEMMLHEALDDDPEMAIGQLQNALMNDVRALSSIGVHTGGMSIAESEQLFREKAFSDPQSARLEAARAGFDPGAVLYSLGKLMLLKLRDDWLAAQPASTLREFHDTFLGWGDSPMRLVRSAMLGETDDGELF